MKCPHCGKDIPMNRSIMDLKDIMAAKQKIADELRHLHCLEAPMGDQWTNQEAHAKHRELRKQIRNINERISSMEL